MTPSLSTMFTYAGVVTVLTLALVLLAQTYTSRENERVYTVTEISEPSVSTSTDSASSSTPIPTSETVEAPVVETATRNVEVSSKTDLASSTENSEEESRKITRPQNPYSFPPFSVETINAEARSVLVNIQCFAGTKGIRSITASGVIIDSRGVILTNAHVGQHVLLSQSPKVNLECNIYHGSPARAVWKAEVLYISPTWIKMHAEDITKERTKGTGEYDYALLRVTSALYGNPLPATFPALPPDTREAIGFLGDPVLAASYPAEFSTGTNQDLYPLTSITTIRELLTFDTGSVDLLSIGGTPGAQGGSSGGAIVNMWGRVVGIITTTSEGATTAERELRAISLYYVNKALQSESGFDLGSLLSGDLTGIAAAFTTTKAPSLIDLLVKEIEEHTM